ncbi:MAG: ABC transporter substrate-binding protein [Pseudomonadota bacterium]
MKAPHFLILLGIALFAHSAPAAVSGPAELVRAIVEKVIGQTKIEHPAGKPHDPEYLRALFEREISPHLDFDSITRWVAGARWNQFRTAEQLVLVNTLRAHVVRLYASLLARGSEVNVELKECTHNTGRSARVDGTLETDGGKKFAVQFRLVNNGGVWQLYDLAVDGVSLARALRADLWPVLRESGIEGLKDYLGARD